MTGTDAHSVRLAAPSELALVAAGGAVGAGLRDVATRLAPIGVATFPTTTFALNVLGAFALGALLAAIDGGPERRWWFRPAVGTGVLGALTTVSTFAVESVELIRDGHGGLAALYVGATVAAGIAAAAAGLVAGGWRPWRPVPDDTES